VRARERERERVGSSISLFSYFWKSFGKSEEKVPSNVLEVSQKENFVGLP
jgi:hypothetical protein